MDLSILGSFLFPWLFLGFGRVVSGCGCLTRVAYTISMFRVSVEKEV